MRTIVSVVVCLVLVAPGCDKVRLPTEPAHCATDTGTPAQVSGTIRSDSGILIGNARVTIGGVSTSADGAGRFSLDTPSGPSPLEIEAPGYIPGRGEIMVTAGSNTIRAVLPSGYGTMVLSGRVLEACSGRPIAGARIGVPGAFATSASDGTYVLLNVGGGTTFEFRVEREGYKSIGPGAFRLFSTATARDFLLERK